MVGGVTPSTWNFGSIGPCWSEIDARMSVTINY